MVKRDRGARLLEAWAAMRGATLAITGPISYSMPPGGATKGHMGYLHAIDTRGGRTTPAELAEALGVTRASVTGALTGMEAAGLVQRRLDSSDRRVVHVSITGKGREVRNAWDKMIMQHVADVLAPLTNAELDVIAKSLSRTAPPVYGPPQALVQGRRRETSTTPETVPKRLDRSRAHSKTVQT
jgi:DNA-binding MarR family transcriptional regulator